VVEEMIIEMFPEFDPTTTARTMFNALVDRANTKTKLSKTSLPGDLEKIQNLTNEIGLHKIEIDFKNQEIEKLSSQILREKEDRQQQLHQLSEKVRSLESGIPTDHQVVVELSPVQSALLRLAAEKLTARYKSEVTPSQIFKELFISYTRQESELKFPYVIYNSDKARVTKEMTQS
jgi:hypothetical protein